MRRAQFLFAEDDVRVDPGTPLRIEVFTVPHRGEIPAPEDTPPQRHDLRVWVYGYASPESVPAAIYDLGWSQGPRKNTPHDGIALSRHLWPLLGRVFLDVARRVRAYGDRFVRRSGRVVMVG